MPQRIPVVLSKMLYIALLLLLLTTLVLSIYAFFNPSDHHSHLEMNYKLVALILLILFLIGIIFIFSKTDNDKSALEKDFVQRINWNDMVLIFLIALSVRLCFLIFYGSFVPPFSDFDQAHAAGLGYSRQENYDLWPAWVVFSTILRVLYFFTVPHFITTQVFNAIITGLTAALIYALTSKMSGKRNMAIVAAAFFTFYPPNILFTATLTPDHLAVLFICIAFLLLLSKQNTWKRHYVFCAVAGIICAFVENLRPMALIIIIAYSITSILSCFINKDNFPTSLKETWLALFKPKKPHADIKKHCTLKLLSKIILSIIILSTTFSISNFLILRTVEAVFRIEFADPANTRAHFIYVGLQPSGEGQVHLGDNPRKFLVLLNETGRDFELAREMTYEFLAQEIRENPAQFAALFPQKFRWAWQDDTTPAYIVYAMLTRIYPTSFPNPDDISPRLLYLSREVFPTVSQIFYITLIALSAIGVLGAFFTLTKQKLQKQFNQRLNNGLFMISLFCFGFYLLLLIMEAQSRYKAVIIPFLCILATYGLMLLLTKCPEFIKQKISRNGDK